MSLKKPLAAAALLSAWTLMGACAQSAGTVTHVDSLAQIETAYAVVGVDRWQGRVAEPISAADRDGRRASTAGRLRNRGCREDAERELGDVVGRDTLKPISERYYADLGAPLDEWNVIYDLEPRPGKAPLAYTDYVRRGRWVAGQWQPTLVRVSGSYARGGLGLLNELVHENGHAIHMMALRTRPAFMDLGEPLFFEAFADVPSWHTYEPAWQQKYLGRRVAEESTLRALYSSVMLDVAWALFELRMLRDPAQDPNAVWTEITSRYLHVLPHPELAWWAVRVQLVHIPGYMVNYGLGAVVTADLRRSIREQLGPIATGDRRWFEWLSQRLLSSGQEQETAALLHGFMGRAVSPQALLDDLERMRKPSR